MTVQWTLAAGFLYAEIGVLLLFCLPFISAKRWNTIFNSRIVATLFEYGNFYFNVVVIVMALLLADSIREARRYSKVDTTPQVDLHNNPQAEMMVQMKLFRAQRNLYISGFSLFLLIVLRRVVRLLSRYSVLEASNEASLRQAQNVSEECKRLMDENDKLKKAVEDAGGKAEEVTQDDDKLNQDLKDMREALEEKSKKLAERTEELEKTKKDLAALKEQAAGLTREYDRLLEEHSKAQAQLEKDENQTGEEKKDN
ncbi:B-cell receptor-associated protein 31-like [Orbicella faveolata]|uniref:B-cell receptor-associated protein 31-like n=1 Tax=Orbicella faveolata TaxID=48498 RepID=UPI0009E50A0D|nr:B-cell receptor-associated protein 31-like [Orbicella faveolata]